MNEPFQDLFKIKGNRKKVEIGNILIAEPFLSEKYFFRSVVFIVEQDEQGSIGFVLNKPSGHTTSELVTELIGIHFPVYYGGPVENDQLYFFHKYPEITDALHIVNGIYWGGDFCEITQLLREGKIQQDEIRFFAGYSGWAKGQLKEELEENTWMVGEITQERFFELPNPDIWKRSMSDLGGHHRIWANFPEDPIMN